MTRTRYIDRMASGHRRRRRSPRSPAPAQGASASTPIRTPAPAPADKEPRVGHGHPLAAAFFWQLRPRPEVDAREVLLACQAVLAGSADERVALAYTALAACLDGGQEVSKTNYELWRGEQSQPAQWPTAAEIENTFGGRWSRAVDFACNGGVEGMPTAARLTATGGGGGGGGGFNANDVLACVHEWAGTVHSGDLTFERYREWARERTRNRDGKRRRYFRSMRPATEHFGGWNGLLEAAGLQDRAAYSRPRLADTPERQEQARVWLRRGWRAKAQGGWLMQSDFVDFVRKQRAQDRKAGRPPQWRPWPKDLHRMFGSWAASLCAAGLVSENECTRRHRGQPTRSDDDLLRHVLRARKRYGREMSTTQYGSWVKERRDGGDKEPGSYTTLRKRFGGWPDVNREADRLALAEVAA